MNPYPFIEHLWNLIWVRKSRFLLIALAPAFGALLLALTLALNAGIQKNISHILKGFGGARMCLIYSETGRDPKTGKRIQSLTADDAASLNKALSDRALFSPLQGAKLDVSVAGTTHRMLIFAVGDQYAAVNNVSATAGQLLTEGDQVTLARVCVLGTESLRTLFPDGNALGREILIRGVPFVVKGIRSVEGDFPWSPESEGMNDIIWIPLATAESRVLNSSGVGTIRFRVRDSFPIESVINDAAAVLRTLHNISPPKEDDFVIYPVTHFASNYSDALASSRKFALILSGVALVLAGTLVMNVFLLATAQRRAEIGLKRALGAPTRSIFMQFVAEAVVLCLAGTVIGLVLSSLAIIIIPPLFVSEAGAVSRYPMEFGWPVFVYPIATAFLLGIFSGTYPAIRAACVDPVKALQ